MPMLCAKAVVPPWRKPPPPSPPLSLTPKPPSTAPPLSLAPTIVAPPQSALLPSLDYNKLYMTGLPKDIPKRIVTDFVKAWTGIAIDPFDMYLHPKVSADGCRSAFLPVANKVEGTCIIEAIEGKRLPGRWSFKVRIKWAVLRQPYTTEDSMMDDDFSSNAASDPIEAPIQGPGRSSHFEEPRAEIKAEAEAEAPAEARAEPTAAAIRQGWGVVAKLLAEKISSSPKESVVLATIEQQLMAVKGEIAELAARESEPVGKKPRFTIFRDGYESYAD